MRGSRGLLMSPVAVLAATYVGYPILVTTVARRRSRRGARAAALGPERPSAPTSWPSMTVVVAAYNEAAVIERKVADLRRQDYPGRVRVLVVADGSTDETAARARAAGADVLHKPGRAGKSAAVNRGVAVSDTELVVLTDANCLLRPGSLRALAEPFADPAVAVVGGVKAVDGDSTQGRSEGLYWRFESMIQAAESELGVVPGAVGELIALRRRRVRAIPAGVINDDYHLACSALADGHRVRSAPEAVASEEASLSAADEFERRTRVAAGTWQTTLAHLRLADPRRGHVAWVFAGHRVLRSLAAPASLPLLLVASAWQSRPGAARPTMPRLILGGQLAVYAAAAAGASGDASRLATAAYGFVVLNLATLRGGLRFLTGRQPVAWRRVARPTDTIPVAPLERAPLPVVPRPARVPAGGLINPTDEQVLDLTGDGAARSAASEPVRSTEGERRR
jgi:biofilm PGA synthesis N-glycosyltransferase PgaC